MKFICGPRWDQRLVDTDPKGKVGIIMSGGIDSWVLYNLLLYETDPIIFNIVRKDGFDATSRVEELTGKPVVRVDESTTIHSERIPEAVEAILANYDLDRLYTGENAAPPTCHFPSFATIDEPKRRWRITDPVIKAPFLHLYKYHIIELAWQNDIPLEGTMSCIRQLDVPCEECWQCREKTWAFTQLLPGLVGLLSPKQQKQLFTILD